MAVDKFFGQVTSEMSSLVPVGVSNACALGDEVPPVPSSPVLDLLAEVVLSARRCLVFQGQWFHLCL